MSTNIPINLIPDRDFIVADVENLVRHAHEFISCGKPPPGAIASEWVPLHRRLQRRLKQLEHAIDDVPAGLWDILQAGPEGAGHGWHLFPAQWQTYETDRHAKVLQWLANIKTAIAAKSANTKTRRGAPKKYPQAMEMGVGLWAEHKYKDVTIHRKCKEAYGAEERIPDVESFMRAVRRAVREAKKLREQA